MSTAVLSPTIKLSLTDELKDFVETEAKRIGLTVASYVRHLIIDRYEALREIPTYEASDYAIKKLDEVLKSGEKFIPVDNVKEFMDNL